MEVTIYPISSGQLKKTDIDLDRLDLKESDNHDLGEIMFELFLNEDKGNMKIYLDKQTALFLSENIKTIINLVPLS